MLPSPLVSIVVPVHNDAETIAASLRTCLAQSIHDIEVICVDDASTDETPEIIDRLARDDSRIRLIRHETNLSALNARRSGVRAASADHVLFVDGDDELARDAVERTLEVAAVTGADLVQFGVTVVDRHGHVGGSYERRLQPRHRSLDGRDVMLGLFPPGVPAQGQLWRYLFRTDLLRTAYDHIPEDLVLRRVNDLPLMFVVAALAQRVASIDEHLYCYHLGRGGSGHRVDTLERAEFYASAIDSVDGIRGAVESIAASAPEPSALLDAYTDVRLWIIGYVCTQLLDTGERNLRDDAVALLRARTDDRELLTAAGRYSPRSLIALMGSVAHEPIGDRDVRSVLLATSTFRTGGVSAVIAAQARILRDAGFTVTVVARNAGSDRRATPAGVELVELAGGGILQRMDAWREILVARKVDVVIDHQVLYTRYWPEFAVATRALGAATVGWIHNFVGRPLYDGDDRLAIIERHAPLLAHVVTLSPLDVSYLKLRGVPHSSFAPNPPSDLLLQADPLRAPRQRPSHPFRLIWWGRLEERTKRVSELLNVAVSLQAQKTPFTMTVIGPDWDDMTVAKFNGLARRRGLSASVRAVGARQGDALLTEIDRADAFVSTSIIEGYQLTIAEAQSRGLPVFMYELPWLLLTQHNSGIASAAQGEAEALARMISRVSSDPAEYERMSGCSIAAAGRAHNYDFAAIYRGIVTGQIDPEASPTPTLEDAADLLGLFRFYAERSADRSARVRKHDSWIGARLWRVVAPAGRRALARFPGLRPLAHKLKKRLGAD